MKRILLISLVSCVLIACVLYNLERKLPSELGDWYNLHRDLMLTKVPTWVDARDITEREHFLRLPLEMQEKYRKIFWEIRFTELKYVFYERLEFANHAFNEGVPGWKTDRGRIFMLAGFPDFVRSYSVTEDNYVVPDVQTVLPPTSNTYLIWTYVWGGGQQANYAFKYFAGDWQDTHHNLASVSAQHQFEEALRKIWAPQRWDVWASILLDWVREKEKRNVKSST